jgi:hypothetical protein
VQRTQKPDAKETVFYAGQKKNAFNSSPQTVKNIKKEVFNGEINPYVIKKPYLSGVIFTIVI